MDFTQRILTFGLLFGVVNGQVKHSIRLMCLMNEQTSIHRVGKAIQHPEELNLDVGKTLKDFTHKSWRSDDKVHRDTLNNGGKQRNQSSPSSPSPNFPHVAQPTSSSQRNQTPPSVHTNAIVTSEKSKENVGIAAVQSPIELGFELGKRRKDPGGLPITNFLESNFVKDTSIRLPSVGITTTEEMISASNLKVLSSDKTGTHRPTTVSATTLTDLIWPDRANTGTTDASSGSNAWVLPSTTTDKSRGWAPSTQTPGSRNLDIWDTQSAGAADGMGLMSMSDSVLPVNRTLSMRFHKLAPDNYNREWNLLQGLSQSIRPLGSKGGMMTTDRPGIRLDLIPHIVKLLGGFF